MTSNPKHFAYDKALFSVVHDLRISPKELNHDLEKKLMIGFSKGK